MSTNRVFQKHTAMRNPHTNEFVYFRPGQILPSWAESEHLNPDLFGEPANDPLLDYDEWSNDQLEEELKRRGLAGKGRKTERIARLEEDDEKRQARESDPLSRIQAIDPVKQEAEQQRKRDEAGMSPEEDEDEEEDESESEDDEDEDS